MRESQGLLDIVRVKSKKPPKRSIPRAVQDYVSGAIHSLEVKVLK